MKQSLPDFGKLSTAAVTSIATGHDRPDFRKAAQAYLDAGKKKPTGKSKKTAPETAPVAPEAPSTDG